MPSARTSAGLSPSSSSGKTGSEDTQHEPGPDPALRHSTYPLRGLRAKRPENLRDATRLQFPVTGAATGERPHFSLGSAGKPVSLWQWQPDLDAAGQPAVAKDTAEGFRRPIRVLVPKERERDVAFAPGRLIPLGAHAWDSASGEKGLIEWWLIRRVRRASVLSSMRAHD